MSYAYFLIDDKQLHWGYHSPHTPLKCGETIVCEAQQEDDWYEALIRAFDPLALPLEHIELGVLSQKAAAYTESIIQLVTEWAQKEYGIPIENRTNQAFAALCPYVSDTLSDLPSTRRLLGILGAKNWQRQRPYGAQRPILIVQSDAVLSIDAYDPVSAQPNGGLLIPAADRLAQATRNLLPESDWSLAKNRGRTPEYLANNTQDAIVGGALLANAAFIEFVRLESQTHWGKPVYCLISGQSCAPLLELLAQHWPRDSWEYRPELIWEGFQYAVRAWLSQKNPKNS